MVIKRTINGREYEFELTPAELSSAYCEMEHLYDCQDKDAILNVASKIAGNTSREREYLKDSLRKRYPVGSKLRVISLVNPEPSLPKGSVGVVVGYDDQPALLMKWEYGGSLSLLPYEGDCFEIVP